MVVLRARRPSADELESLYRNRFQAFLYTATAYVGDADAAWDVVHDAFALAIHRRRSYRGESSLETWVWAIMLNVARDHSRRVRRQPPALDPRAAPSSNGEDFATDLVREGLVQLPERQRVAVFLRYYADLDYDEIARVLGISRGTVAASLNSARGLLRARLTEVQE